MTHSYQQVGSRRSMAQSGHGAPGRSDTLGPMAPPEIGAQDLTRAHALLDPLYRSATEPEALEEFLVGLGELTGSVMPGIATGGPSPRVLAIDTQERWRRDFEQQYASGLEAWARANRVWGVFCYSDVGGPVVEGLLHEWARPIGVRDCLSAHVSVAGSLAGLGVYRELGRPTFSERDREVMRILSPHVGSALLLSQRLGAGPSHQAFAPAVLDRCSSAVVVLDALGRVGDMNDAARAILEAGDGLAVRDAMIAVSDREASRRLRDHLREAIATAMHGGIQAGGALRCPRASGRRPYELWVVPLAVSDPGRLGDRIPSAALFIADPDTEIASFPERLACLYGLTPAESRLAAGLAEGWGLAELAEAFGVTRQTLRNQLKSVFDKTGCRRQGELVSLLLRGVASRFRERG